LTATPVRALRRRPRGTDNPIPCFNTLACFWDAVNGTALPPAVGVRGETPWTRGNPMSAVAAAGHGLSRPSRKRSLVRHPIARPLVTIVEATEVETRLGHLEQAAGSAGGRRAG